MIMKKSASMGCISHYSMMTTTPTSSQNQFDSPSSDPMEGDNDNDVDEYTSDDPNHVSCSLNRRGERKKGWLIILSLFIFLFYFQFPSSAQFNLYTN